MRGSKRTRSSIDVPPGIGESVRSCSQLRCSQLLERSRKPPSSATRTRHSAWRSKGSTPRASSQLEKATRPSGASARLAALAARGTLIRSHGRSSSLTPAMVETC
ncbi:hypothetical protein G6O69_10510 [Pseudenhygromyxa sp. WMMC2535]|uniref:hypothetical protein n=1 Tax=Pseudenhygromyxa sp. WMMC2535 TaxID=2712867 RepID=UPI0015530804|nr:hypothetical protein [Pseudenhygromyxa sp. WMMC2535]NVB38263.1 hypothetical protein [Pseudenhygromyxa sp. WMMC2535]